MLKRLMVLVATLAMVLVVAGPALAQGAPVTATGVLGEPYTEGEEPTVQYSFTDEATGDEYVLISGFVDLDPFVGERITIEAAPVGSAPGVTPALNVTDVELAADYDPAPDAVITGVIQPTADPEAEGSTHTITEDGTGDEYGLFSNLQDDGVDLSQYVGQRATITGYFQTEGTGTEGYDLTDLLIYVESVEILDSAPATDDQYEDGSTTEDPADEGAADEGAADEGAADEGAADEGVASDDQYEDGVVEDGGQYEDSAASNGTTNDEAADDGILSVLPDTGGYSLVVIGLMATLLFGGGGLLAYNLIRR